MPRKVWVINEHTNDYGDHCPWSGTPVIDVVIIGETADDDIDIEDLSCPSMCRDSKIIREDSEV